MCVLARRRLRSRPMDASLGVASIDTSPGHYRRRSESARDKRVRRVAASQNHLLPTIPGRYRVIENMDDFRALDPVFRIIEEGLAAFVDGEHFFDMLADDVAFDFVITVPDYPRHVVGRDDLIELYRGYGSVFRRGCGGQQRGYMSRRCTSNAKRLVVAAHQTRRVPGRRIRSWLTEFRHTQFGPPAVSRVRPGGRRTPPDPSRPPAA